MFKFMRQVSICGYYSVDPRPQAPRNRMMISIDLMVRRILNIQHYSTFGDGLPIPLQFIDSTKQALASKDDEYAHTALKFVLVDRDGHFRIPHFFRVSSALNPSRTRRELAYGWDDW